MHRRWKAHTSGFTLVEVMIALVITSLLVSILMGLLYYVYRVQTTLQAEVVEDEFRLRTQAWFLETLRTCTPADVKTGREFLGTGVEITCDSQSPLRPDAQPYPTRISWTLSKNDQGENLLSYQQQDKTKAAVPVTKLPEGEASFVFFDRKGGIQPVWPPEKVSQPSETLPRSIQLRVRRGESMALEWLVSPLASPWLEPIIKNPFGIDPTK